MFVYETKVKLHETDSAQRLFFANQFKLVHDAFEAFLDSIGFPIDYMINKGEFILPVVHAEADYHAPLSVGDKLRLQLNIEHIGRTSITINCTFFKNQNNIVGNSKIVMVVLNKANGEKMVFPEEFKNRLLQNKN
ncbi:MAG: thioesterase family protein [bacterium]